MNLSADRAISYSEGKVVALPVYTGVTIYAGSLVCVNSSGYAVPAGNTSNYKFVGVARHQADNSGGDSGDINVEVWREGVFDFAATSIAQSNVGDDMYIVDDQTFDESNPSEGIKCGKLEEYISATRGKLRIGYTLASAWTGAADALTVSDAGNHFPAATNTVAEQIQALCTTLVPLTLPRYTGWTKDGADKQMVGPKVELPFPAKIVRAYANLGTAPGSEKELVIKFGASTMITISGTDTQGEAESLDIAVAANADLLSAAGGVLLNETASGSAANLDLMLILARDDGE
ncbi:MAG: hypothetical protein WCR98_02090 [Saccharofermentanales bacterium]|jgi:hypothetical protein